MCFLGFWISPALQQRELPLRNINPEFNTFVKQYVAKFGGRRYKTCLSCKFLKYSFRAALVPSLLTKHKHKGANSTMQLTLTYKAP